ncbi:hypothetical protein NC652_017542 [Populus alba x Populus x berolinensis]|uniref:Uncharacterized protein n=1 Tax=Populus alba x Populus x berolinensis TaxID=444605 RepID=A0AAD6W0K3_9ROSI|nr:hypothetical protein NC652_017542 [Populus alba x Populus x berolinensis]KAJ6994592.1 hypothetical protein NC653_017412 [Populus alba x Populus x berolinensis]
MSLLIVTMLFLHSCQLCGAGKAAIFFTSAIFLRLFISTKAFARAKRRCI